MRNDLTNVEVENKKLNNSIILQEKNMGKSHIIQEIKELKKTKTFKNSKRIIPLNLPNIKICSLTTNCI